MAKYVGPRFPFYAMPFTVLTAIDMIIPMHPVTGREIISGMGSARNTDRLASFASRQLEGYIAMSALRPR